jgi:LPXTG-site transpeptidase (sortase) family protein
LLEEGSVAGFQTIDCAQAKTTGVDAGDAQITVNSVTYDNGTFTATLNLASALPNGIYRLYACGTATLRDLAGNALAGDGTNAGTDFSRNFQVQLAAPGGGGAAGGAGGGANILPATGFPMGKMTTLPIQPAGKAYTNTDMVLEIPSLNQKLTIVGVPQTDDTWDVTWLGNSAGWLNGSAFPTWAGNTVLTGHVWDAYNKPGPFANLKTLKYGDQIKIHAWGQVYTYEVRESKLISSRNVKTVLKHEEYDWVTLLSCEFYNPVTGNYIFRRMVRAVLVSVK